MQHQIFYSSLLLFTFSSKVFAHNIQTSDDVGVTFHIEPDHSPRVGETSKAWFALTRKGGKLISLSECDCDLKVYLESGNNSSNEPILNPTLIAISPEKYQDIPGANIVFPQPGIYQLQLTGTPAVEGDFSPFQVSYPVTVNPGIATPKSLDNQLSDDKVANNQPVASVVPEVNNTTATVSSNSFNVYPLLVGALIGGLGIAALFWLKFSKK